MTTSWVPSSASPNHLWDSLSFPSSGTLPPSVNPHWHHTLPRRRALWIWLDFAWHSSNCSPSGPWTLIALHPRLIKSKSHMTEMNIKGHPVQIPSLRHTYTLLMIIMHRPKKKKKNPPAKNLSKYPLFMQTSLSIQIISKTVKSKVSLLKLLHF